MQYQPAEVFPVSISPILVTRKEYEALVARCAAGGAPGSCGRPAPPRPRRKSSPTQPLRHQAEGLGPVEHT
jgi:hypothetical protein